MTTENPTVQNKPETKGRVVVGTDLSHPASAAVEWAAARAERDGQELVIILVVPEVPMPRRGRAFTAMRSGDYLKNLDRRAHERLQSESAAVKARHPELTIHTAVVDGYPAEVLADATHDAALVVVAARGERIPLQVRALGGTADAVVTHARGPVAVITGLEQSLTGPVVVGVDSSPAAAVALEYASAEAVRAGTTLQAVHAWTSTPWTLHAAELGENHLAELTKEVEEELRELLEPTVQNHPELTIDLLVSRGFAPEILVEQSRDASLLVVGSRGRGGFRGLLLGSTSKEVLRQADCPVVVLRG